MMTAFEKRMRLARAVLFLAIAVWVVSWFFPQLIYGKEAVISMYDGKAEVYAADLWKDTFHWVTRGTSWDFKLRMLGNLMLRLFNLALLLSAPWLVGIYSRAGLLLWLARLMALVYGGLVGYYILMVRSEGAYPLMGSGWWMEYGAALLLVVGLFLIPRRPREVG